MKKIVGIIFVLYMAALLQMSFLVHIFPNGFIVNFIVLSVIVLVIFEQPGSYTGFVAALFGGLLMDIFSGGIIGVWAGILLGSSVIIKLLLERYVRFPIPQKF
jgi:rod shape-determining protein MreD